MNERLCELALQADFDVFDLEAYNEKFERFAELVLQNYASQIMTTEEREQFIRDDEREACAKLCDAVDAAHEGDYVLAKWCAEAIRARSKHD